MHPPDPTAFHRYHHAGIWRAARTKAGWRLLAGHARHTKSHQLEGPEAEWRGALLPGASVAATVAAGGRIVMRGPGEVVELTLTRPAWVLLHNPATAAVRAAQHGSMAEVSVRMAGCLDGAWTRAPPFIRNQATAARQQRPEDDAAEPRAGPEDREERPETPARIKAVQGRGLGRRLRVT